MPKEQNPNQKKKLWSVSNLITLLLFLFVATLFFSPAFKGKIMTGLMKIGLFQPKVVADTAIENQPANLENISFRNQDGEQINLSDQKGKVVFINFWATWCPPCKAERPSINDFYNKFKDQKDLIFLIVDIDNKMEQSLKYIRDNKLQLPVTVADTPIPDFLLGNSVPTTVVIDKTGAIVFRHEGMADYNDHEFQNFIEKLLGK